MWGSQSWLQPAFSRLPPTVDALVSVARNLLEGAVRRSRERDISELQTHAAPIGAATVTGADVSLGASRMLPLLYGRGPGITCVRNFRHCRVHMSDRRSLAGASFAAETMASAAGGSRLKTGCSQDWLPHNGLQNQRTCGGFRESLNAARKCPEGAQCATVLGMATGPPHNSFTQTIRSRRRDASQDLRRRARRVSVRTNSKASGQVNRLRR